MSSETIKSKYGEILPFSAAREKYNRGMISTGSVAFDYLINGGFMLGMQSCVWGPSGSGKTTTLMIAIGQALKKNPTKKVLFVDLDLGLNPDYGAQTAVASAESNIATPLIENAKYDSKRKLWIITDDFGIEYRMSDKEHEEAIHYSDKLATALGDKFYWVGRMPGGQLHNLIVEQIETEEYQMIVIDPQDEIYPKSLVENDVEKEDQGKRSKFLGDFSSSLKHAVYGYDTSIIYTAQMRVGRGQYGSYPEMTGGNRFRHNMDIIVRFGIPKTEIFEIDGKKMLGQEVSIYVGKSRQSASTLKSHDNKMDTGKHVVARLIYGKGWDNDFALMQLGEFSGIIQGRGHYSWIDKEGEVYKGHGRTKFMEAVKEAGKYNELWDSVVASTANKPSGVINDSKAGD
jgi:RecA/RadA recombinase